MKTPDIPTLASETGISIEIIPAKRLAKFAADVDADPVRYAIAPIDLQRATAHSKNPVAADDDPGLIVAYAEGRCIGYVGMLPVWGEVDGKRVKVLAPTTQFVAPEYRKKPPPGGKTVADQMYEASFATGYDQLITGFNEAGGKIYQRRPDWFTPLPSLTILRIRLTPFQPISSAARRVASLKALKLVNPLTRAFYKSTQLLTDRPTVPLTYSLLKAPDDSVSRRYKLLQIDHIDPLELPSETALGSRIYFPRDLDTINWMISNPWHPVGNAKNPHYHFLWPRERFEYRAYDIIENATGGRVGYMVLLFSTEAGYTTMRILDVARPTDLSQASIFNFALRTALRSNVNLIECSGDYWDDISRRPILARLTQRLERGYYMALGTSSVFKGRTSDITLGYCDGERPYS